VKVSKKVAWLTDGFEALDDIECELMAAEVVDGVKLDDGDDGLEGTCDLVAKGVKSPPVDGGIRIASRDSSTNPPDSGSSDGETPTKDPKSELAVLTILDGRERGL